MGGVETMESTCEAISVSLRVLAVRLRERLERDDEGRGEGIVLLPE